MSEFPENDVTIFETYPIPANAVFGPTVPFIDTFNPNNGVEVNKEARRVNNARKALDSIWRPAQTVVARFEQAYTQMVHYKNPEFRLALDGAKRRHSAPDHYARNIRACFN